MSAVGSRSRSPARPPARAARVVGWSLGAALTAAATAGPALAEARVRAALHDRLAVDDDFAIDLDLAGLELRGLARALPDGRGHVRVDRLRVRPGFEGLTIEIDGLDATLRRSRAEPSPTPDAGPAAAEPSTAPPPPPSTAADPLARMLQRLRGVPLEIVASGRVEIELADELIATVSDPVIELDGAGRIHGRGSVELAAVGLAGADLEFWTHDTHPRDLQVAGNVALAGTHALAISGRASEQLLAIDLRERSRAGGRASITLARRAVEGRDRVTIDAASLPLELLEPLAELFGSRLGSAIGEREGEIDLGDARMTGAVEIVRGAGLTRARFDDVELTQLRIDSELLAAEPITFDSLTIDGQLAREHTPAGPRSFGAVVIGHRGVQLELAGQLDPTSLSFDMQLPPTPCQTVLDATPGLSPVLAGTAVSGELEAHFGLDLDFAALDRARLRYLGEDAEVLELEEFEAPGELRFELPYLERCTIERLGPGVDVEGLRGPYHHRFVGTAGVEERRVLAIGDDDYMLLEQMPTVALAFVILEDARFFDHDGFDREQIERAFWFNLLEGRVTRGASTISQQAARSLWLGIDRSLARKLAEAMLAAELERGLDKQRILEIYLNIIELGPDVHGVTEAARFHFGVEPSALSLIDALHLASLAPAPVAYSTRFADGTIDRAWRKHLRRQVRRLRIRHLISAREAEQAMRARPRLLQRR